MKEVTGYVAGYLSKAYNENRIASEKSELNCYEEVYECICNSLEDYAFHLAEKAPEFTALLKSLPHEVMDSIVDELWSRVDWDKMLIGLAKRFKVETDKIHVGNVKNMILKEYDYEEFNLLELKNLLDVSIL